MKYVEAVVDVRKKSQGPLRCLFTVLHEVPVLPSMALPAAPLFQEALTLVGLITAVPSVPVTSVCTRGDCRERQARSTRHLHTGQQCQTEAGKRCARSK
jgi:hypothetical protein